MSSPSRAVNDLTEDERQAVCKLLRNAIDADRYFLSDRVKTWKSALAKLDPIAFH